MSLAPTPSTLELTTDVAIVGAGPVGLMIANYLGQCGVNVTLVEKLDTLIDYPRAIGLDDESLRTFQAVGLADEVLPHTTPWHAMRFLTPKGRCFADIQPKTDEFGWSRRKVVDKVAESFDCRGLEDGVDARKAEMEVRGKGVAVGRCLGKLGEIGRAHV